MSKCRICLCEKPRKNLTELEVKDEDTCVDYVEIMLFCLDIKVNKHDTQFTKLCVKCYRKILDLYKFKKLAHKSDNHLKSIGNNTVIVGDIKKEELTVCFEAELSNDDSLLEPAIYVSPEIKQEPKDEDSQSDDELLSVMKKIKYETIEAEEVKENAPVIKPKRKKKKYIPSPKVCEDCGKTVKDLKAHSRLHLPKTELKKYTCDVCDAVLYSKSALNKHITRRHIGKKQQCKICSKMVTNLKSHVLIIHDNESLPFACSVCGRKFLRQSHLNTHVTVHTKDRPFECHLCGSKFRIKFNLNNHIRQVHEREKSHMCQFCSKTFFKKNYLQIHLRTHTLEKPYECEECGRKFASKTVLKSHMTVHSELKNYPCKLCDMSFARSNYLYVHMKSHIKLKQYPCQYCGRRFHRSDHRRRHQYTAHIQHMELAEDNTTTEQTN